MSTLRVLVVDDHRVLAEAIANAVSAADGMECVGIADDLEPARTLAATIAPDVVVLDAHLPGGDGLDLLADLTGATRAVVLTGHPRPDRERAAFASGAVAYLGKDVPLGDLLDAIAHARPDAPVRDPRLAAVASTTPLTPRENEVLGLLAEGMHVQGVARVLGLSTYTTRDHVKSILGKFGASSQLEAVAAAAREGLVRVG